MRSPRSNAQVLVIPNSRRKKQRFEIHLPLKYTVFDHRGFSIATGDAYSINISSQAVLISEPQLKVMTTVEVSIYWPVLLNDTRKMNLRIQGRVMRSDDNSSCISILSHEFRTRSLNEAPPQKRVKINKINKSMGLAKIS